MNEERTSRQGWAKLVGSVRRHYILDGNSLCGSWGNVGGFLSVKDDDDPSNCVPCRGKLERQRLIQRLKVYGLSLELTRHMGLIDPVVVVEQCVARIELIAPSA